MGCPFAVLCGISGRFQPLSPTERQVAHALLTRPPLSFGASSKTPFDLHVLGMPPAFVLSQDQTLKTIVSKHLSVFKPCFWVLGSILTLTLVRYCKKIEKYILLKVITGSCLSLRCLIFKVRCRPSWVLTHSWRLIYHITLRSFCQEFF